MHPEALKLIVANCHKRQKEGDKPTTHPYSTEQLEDTIVDLNEQLLSALAAIEKHNNQQPYGNCYKIDVDLSALHEHDKKKQKPLVDLLRSIRLTIGPCRDGVIDHSEAVRVVARIDDAIGPLYGNTDDQ